VSTTTDDIIIQEDDHRLIIRFITSGITFGIQVVVQALNERGEWVTVTDDAPANRL
jgi:hypothetical protein